MSTQGAGWSGQRDDAVQEHAARLAARQRAEHDRARALISQFTAMALARLPSERLMVKNYRGSGTAKSDVEGWYLRRDKSVGIGTDGQFYVLTAPLALLDRVRGVRLTPTPPPLVIGAGGRDGDVIDLIDALERLLPGWRTDDGSAHPD